MRILAQMGLGGSVLILMVLIFRILLSGRVPRRFLVFLWLCVIARFLLPFSIPVKWKPVWTDGALLEERIETAGEEWAEGKRPHAIKNHPVLEQVPPVGYSGNMDIKTLFSILRMIWLMGAVLLAAVILDSHRRWMKIYGTSLPMNSGDANEYSKWMEKHRQFCMVRIRVSDQVESPLVCGLFRPVILLPAKVDLNGGELEWILEHERAHIKYWDILTKYLMNIVVCVYWFHPLVWVMADYLNRDMELACDEAALENRNLHDREGYALLLLQMADKRSPLWQAGAYFTKYSKMEERIRVIMKKKYYTWKAGVLAAAVMLCVIPAFTSPKKAAAVRQPEALQAAGSELSWAEAAPSEEAGDTMSQLAAVQPEKTGVKISRQETAYLPSDIAGMAKNYIGNPYRWNGTDLETGVDSSGFVKAIYEKMGIDLPHSSEEMLNAGTKIGMDEIREGDVILYGKENEDHTVTPVHAAIYIGDNQVIHASNAKDGIKISELDYRPLPQAVRFLQ